MITLLTPGKRTTLMISDPWDFVTKCGAGPFWGQSQDVDGNKVLIHLVESVTYANLTYQSAICSLRHKESLLKNGETIAMNMVLLPCRPTKLHDVSNNEFRKGLAVIGSLKVNN
ncbi:MAG: hypothetical protein HY540_06385 [Deltaproteobacteria bacterium]|nr:hypothetical protein [Deltaproteobacteria bacterium]